MEARLLEDDEEGLVALLGFYTALLRMWTSRLASFPERSPWPQPLTPLIEHVSVLTVQILANSSSFSSSDAVLGHLSALSQTMSQATHHPSIRILYPNPRVVYLLAFQSPTVAALSSLTSTLATYKQAFEETMSRSHAQRSSQTTSANLFNSPSTPTTPIAPQAVSADYPRPYVNAFNGFLMDMCNLIWRTRAFNTNDTNALGCMLPAPVEAILRTYGHSWDPPQNLNHLFSLSHHPAIVALSIASFREQEDAAVDGAEWERRRYANGENGVERPQRIRQITERHAGPVTQKSLAALAHQGGLALSWADYRLGVLRWLKDMGTGGIEDLMFCTMKLLMGGRQHGSTGSIHATPTSV